MAEGRITPSQSCTPSPAQSRCVEGAAALPSAPSMQGLFPCGCCASGHPEQPGWAATRAKSSLKLPKHKADLDQGVFRLCRLQVHLLALLRERRCGGRKEEGSYAEKQCKEPDGSAVILGPKISLSWEDLGVSKVPHVGHK